MMLRKVVASVFLMVVNVRLPVDDSIDSFGMIQNETFNNVTCSGRILMGNKYQRTVQYIHVVYIVNCELYM